MQTPRRVLNISEQAEIGEPGAPLNVLAKKGRNQQLLVEAMTRLMWPGVMLSATST